MTDGADAPPLVLGVDGGNTKTIAALADGNGRLVACARRGDSDIYGSGGPEPALRVLVDVVTDVLDGRPVGAVGAAVFNLAGADWPEDFELLRAELAARLDLRVAPLVVNDAIGVVRLGAPRWEGIAVVCGTFNAVGARHRDGRVFHLGFWPDRTGGYDLGRAALHAVYRDGLGLGPSTALTPRLLQRFGCSDAVDLMHAMTARGSRRRAEGPAALTPVLLDAADEGDAVAVAIVEQAGTWLGDQARVSAARVGLAVHGAPVVLSGGVLQHTSPLLADTIMSRLPGAVAVRTAVPPVVGALLLGYDELGVGVAEEPLATAVLASRRTEADRNVP